MRNKNRKTMLIPALLSILFASSLLGTNMAQAAEPVEDPHTKTQGQLRITKEVQDGMVTVSYTFTSDKLDQEYGKMKLYREETFPVGDKSVEEGTETKSATIRIILDSESAKLEQYQDAVNDGMPLNSYIKWEVLRPSSNPSTTQQISLVSWNPEELQIQPTTHVPQWTHETNANSPSDPIATIWDDTADTSFRILDDALGELLDGGWTQSCVGGDQYILYEGAWIKQDEHVYETYGSCSDRTHLRMWDLTSDRSIGAAHLEVTENEYFDIEHISSTGPSGWEDDVFVVHLVKDFEYGEDQVNDEFSECDWDVTADNHWMDNGYERNYYTTDRSTLLESAYNDGYASNVETSVC